MKAHVGRWSEDYPEHQGVVVYSMNNTPSGFGVTTRSTQEERGLGPTGLRALDGRIVRSICGMRIACLLPTEDVRLG